MADIVPFPNRCNYVLDLDREHRLPLPRRYLRALRFMFEAVRAKEIDPRKLLVIVQDEEGTTSYLNLGFEADEILNVSHDVYGHVLEEEDGV